MFNRSRSLFKGFKDFLMQGNVVTLAVAVVVGNAFTAVVQAFTNSIIKPVIAIAGGANVPGLGVYLERAKPATYIDLSSAINAVITFLITASVVYFLFVLPLQRIQARKKKEKEATDVQLLAEIRNLLRAEQGLSPVEGAYLAPKENGTTDKNSTVVTD